MIGVLGFILAFFSLLALANPKTPIGKSILRITFIHNETLIKFYPAYKGLLLLISFNLFALSVYLILSVLDFFLMQSFVLGFFYLGAIASLPLSLFFGLKKKNLKIFKSFFFSLFFFSTLMILLSLYFHNKIENDSLEITYQNVKANPHTTDLLEIEDESSKVFRNRYEKEIKIISRLNMIHQYKKKYAFDYDLSRIKDTSNQVYSELINSTKSLYNSNEYSPKFEQRIVTFLAIGENIEPKEFHLFSVEIQPYFVSSFIVDQKTKYFSSLAVGSKIYLISLYNKIVGMIGVVGLMISIPFLILLSLWLTFRLENYNKKHGGADKKLNNLFFTFVTIFGFILAIISFF